jgi:hypothetical protein
MRFEASPGRPERILRRVPSEGMQQRIRLFATLDRGSGRTVGSVGSKTRSRTLTSWRRDDGGASVAGTEGRRHQVGCRRRSERMVEPDSWKQGDGGHRCTRTQQASQNATRGHHTQHTRPRWGPHPWVCGSSLEEARAPAVRRGARSQVTETGLRRLRPLVESLILAQDQRWRRA